MIKYTYMNTLHLFKLFGLLGFSTVDLLFILLIILILFGAKKLPELSKALRKSAKEIQSSTKDDPNKKN